MSSKYVAPTVSTTQARKSLQWAIDIINLRLSSNALVELQSKTVVEQRTMYINHLNTLTTLLKEVGTVG
jgi:hypothetical protein